MRKILFNYLLLNKRNFIILLILFFIGISLGILMINYSNQEKKIELNDEITEIREIIKESNEINYLNLFILSLKRNCTTILIVWFLGCTIIGGILIYFYIIYQGFLIGYTISAFIAVLGIRNGIIFSLATLLLQNIIFLPALFLVAEKGIKVYKIIHTRCINLKEELVKHTLIMLISILLSTIASFLEVYVSINFLMFFKEII